MVDEGIGVLLVGVKGRSIGHHHAHLPSAAGGPGVPPFFGVFDSRQHYVVIFHRAALECDGLVVHRLDHFIGQPGLEAVEQVDDFLWVLRFVNDDDRGHLLGGLLVEGKGALGFVLGLVLLLGIALLGRGRA